MGCGEKTHRSLLGHYSQQMQVQLEPHKLLYIHQSICNRRETSNREKYENGFNEKVLMSERTDPGKQKGKRRAPKFRCSNF